MTPEIDIWFPKISTKEKNPENRMKSGKCHGSRRNLKNLSDDAIYIPPKLLKQFRIDNFIQPNGLYGLWGRVLKLPPPITLLRPWCPWCLLLICRFSVPQSCPASAGVSNSSSPFIVAGQAGTTTTVSTSSSTSSPPIANPSMLSNRTSNQGADLFQIRVGYQKNCSSSFFH